MKNYLHFSARSFCIKISLTLILLVLFTSLGFAQKENEYGSSQGFEMNKGQIYDESGKFRDDVYFVAHFSGANVFFTNKGVVFYFYQIEPSEFDKIRAGKIANPYTDAEWASIMKKIDNGNYEGDLIKSKSQYYRVDINFPGANLSNTAGEQEKLEKRNYFNPRHPDGLRDVPVFDKIRYRNIFPGIDLIFYIQSGKLKYDFEVAPQANPDLIKILYVGHQSIRIDDDGNALVKILPGEIAEKTPESFQNGKPVESHFITSGDTLKFSLGGYDRSQSLTIDPGLVWSTYFYDNATTSAAFTYTNPTWDSNGNMYIVLNTYNKTNFPMVNPGGTTYYQPTAGDNGLQLVIMKFNTNRQIVWSTYYSGSQTSNAKFTNQCAAIDRSDNLYIIGSVFYVYGSPAPSFPLYNPGGGAYYETEQNNNRNFILKFSSTGDRLWATMFNKTSGSSSSGLELTGITIDNNNKLVVTGETYTPAASWNPIPLVNPGGSYYYRNSPTESSTPTLHRFSTSLALEWSTYIAQGTASSYNGNYASIAVDANNNIFIGSSGSGPYTTVNPGSAYVDGTVVSNGRKISIFKFANTGALNWCTLYGGTTNLAGSMLWQDTRDIKIASNGDLVLVGRGNANNFPTYATGSAYLQSTPSTGSSSVCDGVILQFSNTGVRKWATFYGGNGTSDGTDFIGVGIDASDNITVAGISRSTLFPTLSLAGSYNQSTITGSYACVFARFDINGVRQWASYYGDQVYWSSGGFGLKSQACGTRFVQCAYNDNAYSIPTVNPGNGAYYQGTKEAATGQTDIIAEFFDEAAGAQSVAASSITGTTAVCSGSSTTLTVSGGTLGAGASWHWYSGSCGGTAVGTGTSISVSPTSTTTYYVRAEGSCNTTSCVSQSVTVTPNASIASVSGATPLCVGATTNYSANSVVLSGGTGSWSSSNNGIASVNTSGVVTGNAGGSCNIIYTITGGCGGTVSQQQSITITPTASIASVSGSSPLCIGSNTNYSANSVVLGGGTGAWSSGNSGIANVNAAGNVTGVSAGSTNIIYTITGGCGGTVSQQQSITINPNASIASVSGSSPLCIGNNTNYSANSVVLGGGTGAWSSGNSGIANVNAAGNVTGVSAGSTNIIYTITGGCGGTVSQQQGVTINPNASIASVSGSSPLCIGSNTNYSANSVVLSGGTGAWSSGNSGIASVNASGSVTGVSAGSTNIIYTITGGCGGTISQQQGVTINPNASIASVSGSSPLCIGASTNYSANSVVLGGGTGAWSSGNSGIASVNASGSVTGNSAGSTNIIYTISGGCGGTVSQQQSVTITPNASIASVSGSSPLCPGNSTTYTANSVVTGGGTGAWSSDNTSIATVNSSGLVNAAGSGTTNIIYTISGGCGGTQSAQQSITVSPAAPATPGAITGTATACPGSNGLIYSISNVPDANTYTWTVPTGWSINAGAGTNSISVTAGAAGQDGIITVTAGNSCGTSTSSTLNVTVSTVVAASVAISPSANPVCEGTSVTFTANPVNGGSTPVYQWYLNGSPTGSNSSTFSSSTLTNLNQVYCIMTSSEACATGSPYTSNTVIMTINSQSTAPTSINTTVNPVCPGGSSLLTVQGGSLGTGANWEWYEGSCNGTHLGSGSSLSVNPSGNTDYYVLAQGTCNTTLCANASITVTPVSASASADQTICTGDSVLISVSGTGSFSWTPGGQTAASFYVKPGMTTTYTVTAVNGSCNASDAVTVNVTNAADASITAAGPYCTGQSPVTLTAADPGGVWSGSGITNTSTGIFSPSSAGVGSHQIIYTISGSCGAADTISITVNSSVDASINAAGPFCSNAGIVTLSAANPGGTWSGPGITSTSGGLFNPAISGSGSFNIIYTIAGTCGSADTTTIVVNPAHNASINPSGPYCVTESPVFLSSFENGGVWSGSGITNTSTGSFDPAIAGAGSHEIIYTIAGTCGDADTVNILVNALANTQITSTGPYCNNIGVFDLTAATTGGIWSGAGITNTATGTFNPIFAGVGNHTIIYLITGACGNSDTISLTVLPSPTAYATATDESCINKADGSANVSGSGGTAPYTFLWETAETTAGISGLVPGQYSVILTDANGCMDQETVTVQAATESCETVVPVVYVPNIFTPNGDGNNDVLFVRGQGITEFTLRIYDRWGEKVFETSDLSQGWNGKFRGKDVDQGVFVYTLHVLFADGSEKNDKGNITMTR